MKVYVAITEADKLCHHAYTQGYYWLTMKQDAKNYVKRCDSVNDTLSFPVYLQSAQPVTSPWPFTQWGMDIIGSYSL
ncbi:hypothetical protein CK203_062030 [Vitis vinifera]|uniref:Uncharacterized protein n=1 Tax=Vitis vinifera TaxID=29760 RepID=A0A438GEU9_VITVI|nr:hypothetical protein CK203_062030 [Vitis vinifera]